MQRRRAECLDPTPMRHQNIMPRLIAPRLVGVARRKAAQRIADVSGDRLVNGRPHGHQIAEGMEHFFRVLAKPFDAVAVAPAALFLQNLRKIPMIQRDIGENARLAQRGKDPFVIIDSGRIERADALRQNARPRNGEAVTVHPKPFEVVDIALIAVIAVTGNGGGLPAENFARLLGKRVPDAGGTAILQPATLYLTGAGRHAPHKILRKRHILSSFRLQDRQLTADTAQ